MNDKESIQDQPEADASEDLELEDENAEKVGGGGIENPTTIGSATSGAGAGKIKFN